MRALVVKQDKAIVVTAETILNEVTGDQRDILLAPLGLRIFLQIAALGGEAGAERAARQAATSARISGFSTSSIGGMPPLSFFNLCSAALATR